MSASRHIHPGQLQMLMTGTELKNKINVPDDAFDDETMDDMWSRKSAEAKVTDSGPKKEHGAGVYDSLSGRGYDGPPLKVLHGYGYSRVSDGHHRVAATADLEKEGKQMYVPVEHHQDDGGAFLPSRTWQSSYRSSSPDHDSWTRMLGLTS